MIGRLHTPRRARLVWVLGALLLLGLGAGALLRPGDRQGLSGAYFWNPLWEGPPWREDVLDPDISHRADSLAKSARRAPGGQFSVEWIGHLDVVRAGHYAFSTSSKGASWVWLDGVLVASSTEVPGTKSSLGERQLGTGPHDLRIRYVNHGSEPFLEVLWAPGGGSLESIPASRLRAPALTRGARRAIFGSLLLLFVAAALVLRRDFLVLLAVVFYVNLPYLTGIVWDLRDTNTAFQLFYVHYNEFYYSGRLALWLPYGTYGQAVDFTLALPGIRYLVIAVGKALGVTDAWRLFVVNALAEQTVLLLGVFLLARRLFASRGAVFMVCLASIGSLVWYWNSFFSLQWIYLLPLLVFFLISFFDTRRPHYLWLMGICAVFWAQGGGYAPAIWLFTCCMVAIPLSVDQPRAWRAILSRSRANLLLLATFVLLAVCFASVAASSMRGLTLLKNRRDRNTGTVALSDFLQAGGTPKPDEIVRNLLTGKNSTDNWDNNLYMGLLPLFCLVWALCKVRAVRFVSIAWSAGALVWLAFGGVFARVAFHFPLMGYVRWLAWMYPTAKLLAIVAAGFGFARLWSEPRRLRQALGVGLLLVLGMDAAGVSLMSVSRRAVVYAVALGGAALLQHAWRWASRDPARRFGTTGLLQFAAIAALAFDLYTYQQDVWRKLPWLSLNEPGVREMVSVQRMEYQPQRTEQPPSSRGVEALRRTAITFAPQVYSFLLWDPCRIASPKHFLFSLPARTVPLRGLPEPTLSGVVGCSGPKLRLVTDVARAKDADEAARLLQEGVLAERAAVIEFAEDEPRLAPPRLDTASNEVRVTRFDSNTLEAVADVAVRDGAWLVYADAFHPGWRASVDGRPARVVPANLAFKAVRLPPGTSRVRFEFWDGWRSLGLHVLAGWSVLMSLALMLWAARVSLQPAPP
jgi:hypothetical protein